MPTITQKTWDDVWARIAAFLAKEGITEASKGTTDYEAIEDECMALANEGIAELSARAEMETAVWTDGESGDLEMDEEETCRFALPIDFIAPEDWEAAVWYDGEPLSLTSEAELNREDSDWRTRTGDPGRFYSDGTYVYLDYTPASAGLELRGHRIIGEFATGEGEVNPLTKLRGDLQLAVVEYVKREYPYNPEDSIQAARQASGERNWERAISRAVESIKRRRYAGFDMSDELTEYEFS